MIRGYADDRARPICPGCPTDDEKESESVTVVLEEDEWRTDAIPYGAICSRCGKVCRIDLDGSGEWETQ